MHAHTHVVRRLLLPALLLAGCDRAPEPDAYGTFEATEVVVAAQTAGQLERFDPVEGTRLARGAVVALVDTVPLALERAQLDAQRAAAAARDAEAAEQLGVLEAQRDVARRAYERTRRLHDAQAATAQQLDQAERDHRVVVAQIEAARAQRRSVGLDVAATEARVAQVQERLGRAAVENPRAGVVLATYARAGETVQAGQPLYRVADLDTLELRAYVDGTQLAAVRLGAPATVRVTGAGGALHEVRAVVSWVASEAEFTPTPVQTRDERAELVYAVKLRVANPDGALKIGMPADVTFGAAAPAVARRP